MKVTILEQDGTWYVGAINGDDKYPTTGHDTQTEALIRLLQILFEYESTKE